MVLSTQFRNDNEVNYVIKKKKKKLNMAVIGDNRKSNQAQMLSIKDLLEDKESVESI